MSKPLSCCILTFNSEKYLEAIFRALEGVIDDWVIVDSGSTDGTAAICAAFGITPVHRALDNFVDQRNFALARCANDWVLVLDSDEVPDAGMVYSLAALKGAGFATDGIVPDGYHLKRMWYLFDRPVHAFYPIQSPDDPMRLFRRSIVRYDGNYVHEEAHGATTFRTVEHGYLLHYSCESVSQLINKLNLYTTLAAQDMLRKGKPAGSWANILIHSSAAWVKWYIRKGGFRDGSVGFLLGAYAFLYTFFKYTKRKFDNLAPP